MTDYEPQVHDGVCRLGRPRTRWLSTGWDGGESVADAAYNVTVPEGWPETDLDAYCRQRRERADFSEAGPTLLTGVAQRHARVARRESVTAVVTAGVSNPASLPVPWEDATWPEVDGDDEPSGVTDRDLGTVNLLVGTTRALAPGALANLLAVAAEAKAATLLPVTGFPGTTTDAAVVGCARDCDGDPTEFSGSATPVGAATRACVRDALLASLGSRYPDSDYPESVADAEHGVVTDERATVTAVDDAGRET